MTQVPPERAKLLSIQYLRAIAAMSVVVYHAVGAADLSVQWPAAVLSGGVDIFFVISGFVMWVTTVGRGMTPADFWRRRVERIVPLYWIATTLAVVLAVVLPSLMGPTDFKQVLTSYLFLPNPSPDTGRIEPIVAPGWTLNYEMFFYVMFGAALVLAARRRVAVTCGVLAGLVVIGALTSTGYFLSFYTNNIILEFGFGLLVGVAYTSGVATSWRTAGYVSVVAVAAMVGIMSTDAPRAIAIGLPSAAIVAACAFAERRSPARSFRWPLELGDASYSIYLAHGTLVTGIGVAADRSGAPMLAVLLVAPIAAAILGDLVYRYIERPISTALRARRPTERPPATPTAVGLQRSATSRDDPDRGLTP